MREGLVLVPRVGIRSPYEKSGLCGIGAGAPAQIVIVGEKREARFAPFVLSLRMANQAARGGCARGCA